MIPKFETIVMAMLLALLLLKAAAHASAFTGTLISAVTADQVRYNPGSTPHIAVELRSLSEPYVGHLDWVACERTKALSIGSIRGISIAPGTDATETLSIHGLPARDHRGYMVFVAAYRTSDNGTVSCIGNSGNPIDKAARGIDISSDWTRFPRAGWNSTFLDGTNEQQIAASLAQYGINYVIHYDVDCKAHEPYCAAASWPDLEGETVTRASVAAAIDAEHRYKMVVALFEDVALADDNYLTDGSGANLALGLFKGTGNSVGPSCGRNAIPSLCDLGKQATFGSFPGGWRTKTYYLMNLGNSLWQSRLFGNIKAAFATYPYDAFQADTLGAPVGRLFDAGGSEVHLEDFLADYTNTARSALQKPTIVNSVSLWSAQDIATHSAEPFFFAEMHPEFGDFATFTGPAQIAELLRQWTSKTLVMAAYINKASAASKYGCSPPPGAFRQSFLKKLSIDATCYINTSSAELADWAFITAGIDHLELGDYDLNCGAPKFADSEFWKGPMLCMKPALQTWLYNLAQMQMGYENLFFDAVVLAPETVSIISGGKASTDGTQGTILVQARTKAGFAFWDFINLTAVNSGEKNKSALLYQDTKAAMLVPSTVKLTVAVQAYGTIPKDATLYAISPDWGGQPKLVKFTTAINGSIIAKLPAFLTGIRLVLETSSLSDVDYDINPRLPFRGAHYEDASPGCGTPKGTTSLVGGNGCSARFSGLQFGKRSSKTFIANVRAITTTTLELRLDNPNGRIVARGTVPEKVSSIMLPLTDSIVGRHDLYVRFPAQAVNIYTMRFE